MSFINFLKMRNKIVFYILLLFSSFSFHLFSQTNSFVWIGETEANTLKTIKSWEKNGFKIIKELDYDKVFKSNVTTYKVVSDDIIYFNITVFKGKVANYMYIDEAVEYSKTKIYMNTIKSSKQWKALGNGYFLNNANPFKKQQDLFTYYGSAKSGKGRVLVFCSVINSKIPSEYFALFKKPGFTFEVLK
jgi:hypothetical protein